MKQLKYILIVFSLIGIYSCEDAIDLDLDPGANQLVVDAFLNNDSGLQTIRLTQSAAYFSNVRTPSENLATVDVIGPDNKRFNFISDGNGNFNYDTQNGLLDSVGFSYQLELVYNGITYKATSILNPVPKIDTMTYSFEEEELGSEEGYYAQFFATDFAGRKDYYWIKAFKNGISINEENNSSLILSEDAAFSGGGADGFPFILPIRAAITNEDDPFELGDVSSVELWSMELNAYEFIEQVTIQTNNGGLFATPPANIRSNILDGAGNLQEEVLGVFSLSAISRDSILIR